MAMHRLKLDENKPLRLRFTEHYALVEVYIDDGAWRWRELHEETGRYVGDSKGPFRTEQEALNDALVSLDGVSWE